MTGLPLNDAVRAGLASGVLARRPAFDRITATGAVWADGSRVDADVILWATGFRAAVDHLAPLHLREPGGGIRVEGTRAVRDERVHLVGYGPSASTIGANRAGGAAVREIRRLLARERTGAPVPASAPMPVPAPVPVPVPMPVPAPVPVPVPVV